MQYTKQWSIHSVYIFARDWIQFRKFAIDLIQKVLFLLLSVKVFNEVCFTAKQIKMETTTKHTLHTAAQVET